MTIILYPLANCKFGQKMANMFPSGTKLTHISTYMSIYKITKIRTLVL